MLKDIWISSLQKIKGDQATDQIKEQGKVDIKKIKDTQGNVDKDPSVYERRIRATEQIKAARWYR